MIRAPSTRAPSAERPWSVPVAVSEVPETGRHFDLVADEPVRTAVAQLAGVGGVPRLQAAFDLTPHGRGGLRVVGRLVATVSQTCVVTLEPIDNSIDESIDLVFAPEAASPDISPAVDLDVAAETPEPLFGGSVDLGAIATEFLLLAVDPYPRKPGAVFQPPATEDDSAHPFAPLAALKHGQDRGGSGR